MIAMRAEREAQGLIVGEHAVIERMQSEGPKYHGRA
jgi:hypothetical protein